MKQVNCACSKCNQFCALVIVVRQLDFIKIRHENK